MSVLFGDLLSQSYNITFSMFLYLVCVVFADFTCHSYQHNILVVSCILRLESRALIPGMADFGGNLLTSSTPISLRRQEFGNTNIQITLAVDNIGQEGTERGILRMRIAEDSVQPPGTFFKRDLRVTINDTSSE